MRLQIRPVVCISAVLALSCEAGTRRENSEFVALASEGREMQTLVPGMPLAFLYAITVPDSLGVIEAPAGIAVADAPACLVSVVEGGTGEVLGFSHGGRFARVLSRPARGEIGSRWLGPPTWISDSVLVVANWSRSEAILTDITGRPIRRFTLPSLSDSLAPTHNLTAGEHALLADQWFNSRIPTWSANWDSLNLPPIVVLDTTGRVRAQVGSLLAGGGDFLTYALNRGVPVWLGDTLWYTRLSDAVIQGFFIPPSEIGAEYRNPTLVLRPPLFQPVAIPFEVKPRGAKRWQPVVRLQATAFAARSSEFALAQTVAEPDSLSGVNLRTALVLWNRATDKRDVLMVGGEIRAIGLTGTRAFLTIAHADQEGRREFVWLPLPSHHRSPSDCPDDRPAPSSP